MLRFFFIFIFILIASPSSHAAEEKSIEIWKGCQPGPSRHIDEAGEEWEFSCQPQARYLTAKHEKVLLNVTIIPEGTFFNKRHAEAENAKKLVENLEELTRREFADIFDADFGFSFFSSQNSSLLLNRNLMVIFGVKIHLLDRSNFNPPLSHDIAVIQIATRQQQSSQFPSDDYKEPIVLSLSDDQQVFEKSFQTMLRKVVQEDIAPLLICGRSRNYQTEYCQSRCPSETDPSGGREFFSYCNPRGKK